MRFAATAAFVATSLTSLFAQQPDNPFTAVPRLVRMGGSFHSANGLPVGPTESATLSIYKDEQGGQPLWQETQNVTLDANGQYTALLGITQKDGVPVDLFSSAEPRWLGVQFNRPGETEQPRIQLASVPYAIKAVDAETLGGKPASAYLLDPNAATTGTASSGETLTPAASPNPKSLKPHTINGTMNHIPYFTDNSNDLGNSVIYQNGSNIGVGTTSALISMDVRQTPTSLFPQFGVAQTVDYLSAFASDIYGPAMYWDPAKDMRFGKGGVGLYDPSGFVESMRIQSSTGNVGIGTQAPAISLDVRSATFPQIGVAQTTDYLAMFASDSFGPALYWDPAKDMRFGKAATGLYNLPGFVESMRIQSSTGNVGIGTTTPASKVDVAGDINFSGTLRWGGNPLLSISGTSNGSSTGLGFGALQANTGGDFNSAFGNSSLQGNTTGSYNTAIGAKALQDNTTGGSNTSVGFNALEFNTGGISNTAVGASAMLSNTTGGSNTASGFAALANNITGNNNTAFGTDALVSNHTGSNNIAIGYYAAQNLSGANSNNIHIGTYGAAADNGTIRIGGNTSLGDPAAQTSFFVAGVLGVTTGNNDAIPVLIDSAGQLGTVSSSRRYKEDIQDMGDASSGLLRLRPVTFRYQKPFADGSKPVQYGLIAEEVAEVYPDLVAHSADGQIETVKYQVLDSMLLNEVQRQQRQITTLNEQNQALLERLSRLEAAMAKTQ